MLHPGHSRSENTHMTTTVDRQDASPQRYRVVGTRPIRHDGVDKVTGAAKYGADTQLAGILHGKILHSPHAHARIRSIDTSKAEALTGVFAVATSKDFPCSSLGKSLDFIGATRGL